MWKRQNKMEMLEMWNVYWFLIPFYVTMKDTVVSFDEDSKQKMWKLDLRKNVLCLSQKTFSFVSARKHQDSVFVSEDVNFSGSLRKYYLFNLKCFWSLSGCWFSLWRLLLLWISCLVSFFSWKWENCVSYVFWISCVQNVRLTTFERLWVELGQSSWDGFAWNTIRLGLVVKKRILQWKLKKNRILWDQTVEPFGRMRNDGNITSN